jgi:hypothetical protein
MSRTGRPSDPRSKLKSEDPRQGDGREGLWSRARLEQMDARFVQRVERAIARGDERLPESEPG